MLYYKLIKSLTFIIFLIISTNRSNENIFLKEINQPEVTATYYSDWFNNRLTSEGNIFNNNKLSVATSFPEIYLNKRITFINKINNRKITLKCNDKMNSRMRIKKHRVHFDLSKRAMRFLAGDKGKRTTGKLVLYIQNIE